METSKHMTLGFHVLVEMYRCDTGILNDPEQLQSIMTCGAESAGATIITQSFHHFSPYGVSGVLVISESHFTIHTWPEYGYASLDLYTCGDTIDSKKAFHYIRAGLHAGHTSTVELHRGNLEEVKDWQDGPI